MANALSPAQVLTVQISEDDNTASVIVPDRQLSLAIGKEGQNARLAAKLTGWRIDIKPESAMGDVLAAVAAATPEAPAKPKKAAAAPIEDEDVEAPEVVREPEPDMATLLAEAEAPRRAPAEVDGPRIRFAEELTTATSTKADPKKKKSSKKEERPEADAKVVKKTPKRDKRLAAATDDDDEDIDVELDWGSKDEDDDEEI